PEFFSGECEDYYITILDAVPLVRAKVYLESYDAGSGVMNTYLKTINNFPLVDPYFSAPLNSILYIKITDRLLLLPIRQFLVSPAIME
ncbi:MAG: hypothetical protein ACOYOA_02805, partial [Saprospiraceae bacterium]